MTAALVLRLLRQQRALLLALVVGVFGLELVIVLLGASFGPTMLQMFEALPPFMRNFVGSQLSEMSLTGFVGFGFQHPGTFAMTLSFALLTATIPAAERESGLLDLLLAHPVTRRRYLGAVVLVLVVSAVLLPLAALLGAGAGLALIDEPDEPPLGAFLPSALGLATLLLAWGGIALLCATRARRRGTAAAWAAGGIVVLFLLEAFSELSEPLKAWAWLSPFHHFKPIAYAVSGLVPADPAILLAIFLVFTGAALWIFQRRDL